jgi:hypothetical protein
MFGTPGAYSQKHEHKTRPGTDKNALLVLML